MKTFSASAILFEVMIMTFTIENIEKEYDRPVLKGISHTFTGGKLYVIKGVSGCGKSTLFNILGGIETSFSGEITLDGESLENKPDMLRAVSGYIYQQSLLLSGISVRDNLLFIKNDPERVETLCRELGLGELLDRLPEELSGGERQRVSAVRALLSNPRILLADEPTASLDNVSSNKMASLLAELRQEDRIILVATHEHWFDEIADEIIDLRYGEIASVRKFDRKPIVSCSANTSKSAKKSKEVSAFAYSLKRGKGNYRFSALLPFAFIFLIIMLISTVQNCMSDEYISFIEDAYPVDTFNLKLTSYAALPEPYKSALRVYDGYEASDGAVRAVYLAEREDSVISIDGMLEYGSFPKSKNEIVISHEYATDMLGTDVPVKAHVGEKIVFLGQDFTISGILYSIDWSADAEDGRNDSFYSYLLGDAFYRYPERITGDLLFIPYATLKDIGDKITDNEYIRCTYKGIFHDKPAYEAIEKASGQKKSHSDFTLNVFEQKIDHVQDIVDGITAVLFGVLVVAFVIACIFISSQVQIELFYRKRELGFLQIFGVKKRRVKKTVLAGYVLKITFALLLSMIMYLILIVLYYIFTRHAIIFNPLHISAVVALIVLFYLVSVSNSTTKFLKRSIIELVTE